MRSRSSSRMLARAAVILTAGAVALTGQQVAQAKTTIDTWTDWNGCCSVGPFGHPDSATYGQVLTIPAGEKKLTEVTWYMYTAGGPGTLIYRSAVYTWDGAKAGKKVAIGKKTTVEVDPGSPGWEGSTTKFKKKAKVKAGQQYVVFATVALDYEETDPGLTVSWPVTEVDGDQLPGGDFVFINDGGNEDLWTTQNWGQIPFDNAFQAKLK